ncbi:MAG: methyltransferase family protein [Planctomycetota bacterium]|jgi:protein-S-isoprenylcysteine O-methyltransferase Ste14
MWIIRFTLLGAVGVLDCGGAYLCRYREKYGKLLENKIFNIALVILGHCLCYSMVILPPTGGWKVRPLWMEQTSVRIGFPVIGLLLICAGASSAVAAFKQRKVIGAQDVKEGLLTSGCYRYFRHPINTGILWVTLGLPLAIRNPDGLLIYPAFFVLFLIGTILEERSDMCLRFPEEYRAYRKTTRMFGPIWIWAVILASILLTTALAWSTKT